MTPDDLSDLAESLVPLAARLAGAVRDDVAEVGRVLALVPPAHMHALAVVLAAMVPDDRTPRELLSWVDWGDDAVVRQASLFDAAADPGVREEFPDTWTDDMCKRLHRAWRKRIGDGAADRRPGDTGGDPMLERLGYLQWEQRRKRRARQPGLTEPRQAG